MLFELQRYDADLHRVEPAVPSSKYEPASDVLKMSLLYWAEHCIECAAPACYQTCDLYRARSDGRCRRFTFGAFKNRNFPSLRGHGVEVSFKKWAKMEAYGNLRLHPSGAIVVAERMFEWVAPVSDFFGKLIARLTRKPRWRAVTHVALEELVRRLNPKKTLTELPDAFLLEVYNPTQEVVRMFLSFSALPNDSHSHDSLVRLPQGFAETVICPPGYSRREVDAALLRQAINSGAFLVSLAPEADQAARLVFLSADFVKFAGRYANADEKNVKCVVFDLDNTLWTGVLAEGDDVVVRPEAARLLKHLDQRGILLSIASKNDYAVAWEKVRSLGLDEYFLYPQINWNPKSESVKTIAEKLNIGVDAVAFVDDNPFELDEVSKGAPAALCVNSENLASLFTDLRFRGSTTGDALRRRQLYREAATRETVEKSFGQDYLGFLASCEIHLDISPFTTDDSERVAELVQRTNQLNFSGHKHTRAELERILSDSQLEKLVLKSHDRYGSYGTVGFCIVEQSRGALLVRDLMLSCRVQGKLLEKALFHHLLEHHAALGSSKLWVNFRKTARNTPAHNALESMHFRTCKAESDGSSHGMILDAWSPMSRDAVCVNCSCNHPRALRSPKEERLSA